MADAIYNATSDSTADAGVEPSADVLAALEHTFGFQSFRPGQAEVIDAIISGRSALAVFPTGSGKSLCYQLPALLLDGLTVVICPLIALMKDQLDFLASRGVPAARIDSSLSREEQSQVLNDLQAGRLRLLYVSPERLGNERFLQLLRQLQISLLVVDEAHCISEWGHNFRPDYLRISAPLVEQLRISSVLALTATATPEVADDVAEAFHIEPADVIQTGFYRPNLSLHVSPVEGAARKALLVERLREHAPGTAVVYVTLQRTAEQVAEYLRSEQFRARAYHAGLPTAERTEIQDEFMCADNMIIVATIAFGMGIDKSNLRAVFHYNLPKSLESYMQEIGRAGRDGQPARCEILACGDDVIPLENFSYGDTPTAEAIATFTGEILSQGRDLELPLYSLSRKHDIRDLVLKTLLTYLELEGVLQPAGPIYTEYKFQAHRSSAEILQRFDPDRARFVAAILKRAKKGSKWFTIDAADVASALGEPRQRVVAALDYLDQQGDILLTATGVRHRYRVVREVEDRGALVETLTERFERRESQDLARVHAVVELLEAPTCITQSLLGYFGEAREPCGHCDRCAGAAPQPLPTSVARITDADRKAIATVAAEGLPALAAPRQLTRFLCGTASPAAMRDKLRSHAEFGRLAHIPFAEVLAAV